MMEPCLHVSLGNQNGSLFIFPAGDQAGLVELPTELAQPELNGSLFEDCGGRLLLSHLPSFHHYQFRRLIATKARCQEHAFGLLSARQVNKITLILWKGSCHPEKE